MAQTLYATFSNPNNAQSAAAEMLEQGIGKDEISLFIKKDGHVKESTESVDLIDTRPTTPMQGTEFNHGPDPMGNGLRQLSVSRIERGVDADIRPPEVERDPNAGVQKPAEPKGTYMDVSDSNDEALPPAPPLALRRLRAVLLPNAKDDDEKSRKPGHVEDSLVFQLIPRQSEPEALYSEYPKRDSKTQEKRIAEATPKSIKEEADRRICHDDPTGNDVLYLVSEIRP